MMIYKIMATAMAAFALPNTALASNACAVPAIDTYAAVTTSYGAEYGVQTTYRTRNDLVTQFVRDTTTTFAVEGAETWVQGDTGAQTGGNRERGFAIGHQYHALLLHFDDIIENVRTETEIDFNGEIRSGRTGDYPTGGTISLIDGAHKNQPAGMLMLLPEEKPITNTFSDWQEIASGETTLPHQIIINHDENIFTYIYSKISIGSMDAIDMQARYVSPEIDGVKIHRLHRVLMAAHCRGDFDMMADLSSPKTTIANRGEVTEVSQEETREMFESIFEQIQYSTYRDIETPVIRVADSGDIGWAIVNVHTDGQEKASGTPFSYQWAWVMLAEKRDGEWVYSGNASNVAPTE